MNPPAIDNGRETTHGYLNAVQVLLDEAEHIESLEALDFAEEVRLLGGLRTQLDRPLAVAVVGEFSTGKSTFINAVLGNRLLPAKYVPTTKQLMRISHSDEKGKVSIPDDARPCDPLPTSPEAITELAKTGAPLNITTPIPSPWSDLVIYDTPGVNDATAIAEQVIIDLMDKVDVVLFMLRSDAALHTSELLFLGQLVRQKDLDKFFFNVNFSDGLPAGTAEDVRTRVADTLGRLRNWPIKEIRERVFLCSAKHTLDAGAAHQGADAESLVNEHEQLLHAIHVFASSRKRELLSVYPENLIRIVAESAAEKLTAAIDAAGERDAQYGQALIALTQEMNDFRVSIREQEIAFQDSVRSRKKGLIRNVGDAFDDIHRQIRKQILAAERADFQSGDWLQKRLRVEVEDRLVALTTQFRGELEDAVTDLDARILPQVNRTIDRIEGIQRRFDYSPLVAGAGVATAGYAVATAVLPWVAGAAGIAAVTAGVASFVPGVGVAIGAMLGAGLRGAAVALFSGTASAVQTAFGWLRDATHQLQQKQDKERTLRELDRVIDKMKRDVVDRLDSSIDPVRLSDGIIAGRFPQQQALQDRRMMTAKLDRSRLREALHDLENLRARFMQSTAHLRMQHG